MYNWYLNQCVLCIMRNKEENRVLTGYIIFCKKNMYIVERIYEPICHFSREAL